MHYPILLETELAKRWQLSVKTLRNWRQRNVGPRWYKLYHHVRYHAADVLAYEADALPRFLVLEAAEEQRKRTGKVGNFVMLDDNPPQADFVDGKAMAASAKLPHHFFADHKVRNQRQIPHLQAGGLVRYSTLAIWRWELEHSEVGPKVHTPQARERSPKPDPNFNLKAPRWYEITPSPAQPFELELGNALITRHCPTLPSALEDFPHTYQHPISKDL